MSQLSTQPYKGTRDFYPEDMRVRSYIFNTWRVVAERFGYEQYDAPMLEPTDLYRAKTGEEIVSEQTYSFRDRGGRDVTIRPEMTPSLARMVAARQQELPLPLRWYSMPNLWRYERPQRGRLREHWQLNVDLFGLADTSAEFEIISLAHALLHEFGADDDMFVIKLNSRELMSYLYGEYLELSVDAAHRLTKLLDRKNKISEETFVNQADAIVTDKLEPFLELMKVTRLRDLPEELRDSEPAIELANLAKALHAAGISNLRFDLSVQRGFDYYTGIVFEVFDTNHENPRSLFGGGRYDELLQIFGQPRLPAVGFGMGDVITLDFLQTHKLLSPLASATKVAVLSVESEQTLAAQELAAELRGNGINAAVDATERKLGTKIKTADKQAIPFVIIVGEEEVKNGKYVLKQLASGEESQLKVTDLIKNLQI